MTTASPYTLNDNRLYTAWVAYDGDGIQASNLIKGFLWPDDLTLHASNEKIAWVMTEGDVHFRQRGEDRFAIFMDYVNDSAVLQIKYTATCITDRAANLSLNIFPH